MVSNVWIVAVVYIKQYTCYTDWMYLTHSVCGVDFFWVFQNLHKYWIHECVEWNFQSFGKHSFQWQFKTSSFENCLECVSQQLKSRLCTIYPGSALACMNSIHITTGVLLKLINIKHLILGKQTSIFIFERIHW